jgi:Cu/Ag efflux protein CusF
MKIPFMELMFSLYFHSYCDHVTLNSGYITQDDLKVIQVTRETLNKSIGKTMNRLMDLVVAGGFLCVTGEGVAQASYPQGSEPTVIYGQIVKIDRGEGMVSVRQVMPKNVGMVPITLTLKANGNALDNSIHEGDKIRGLIQNVDGRQIALKLCRRPWPIQ